MQPAPIRVSICVETAEIWLSEVVLRFPRASLAPVSHHGTQKSEGEQEAGGRAGKDGPGRARLGQLHPPRKPALPRPPSL